MTLCRYVDVLCDRYKDLVDDEDHERLTRVMTALEKKDEMQTRMEAITKSGPLHHSYTDLHLSFCLHAFHMHASC